MSSDTQRSVVPDDEAAQISATWQMAHRRPDEVECAGLVTGIAAALDRRPTATLDVAAAAAGFGAAWARSGRTLNGLVEDLDLLEGIWLDHVCDREPAARRNDVENDARAHVRRLHSLFLTARQSAIAAFAHTSASATRTRLRLARHDILNAVGAVRNAVVLMDDRATDTNREHVRGIATRNSFSAEALVRLHLSDGAALTTGLGWEQIGASEHSAVIDAAAGQLRGAANVGALDAIVRSLRAAYECDDARTAECIAISVSTKAAGVGLLTVCAPASADRGNDLHLVETIRQLADSVGVKLEEGSSAAQLRFVFPLSDGDQRHDLGGTGQGHHSDSVRL